MRLRHVVVYVRIVRTIDRPDLPLSRYTAVQFFADLLPGDLLAFVSTGDEQNDGAETEKRGDYAFQALTLSSAAFHCNHRHRREDREMIPPEVLLQGYKLGIFPMAMENGEIEWFSPNPRAILPLDSFKIPHGLRRVLRQGRFDIRANSAFDEVMRMCAARDDTWINHEIIASYTQLHRLGHAHSLETWQDGELAGGLYGVAVGGAFFGESMFHRVTNASKVALCALVERLRDRGFTLLDTQWQTPHLRQFGVVEIQRRHYLRLLARAVQLPCAFV